LKKFDEFLSSNGFTELVSLEDSGYTENQKSKCAVRPDAEIEGTSVTHDTSKAKSLHNGLGCSVNNNNFRINRRLLSIKDFSAADPLEFIDGLGVTAAKSIPGLIAHCTGGTGRTGFFLAAYVMKLFSLFDPVSFKS